MKCDLFHYRTREQKYLIASMTPGLALFLFGASIFAYAEFWTPILITAVPLLAGGYLLFAAIADYRHWRALWNGEVLIVLRPSGRRLELAKGDVEWIRTLDARSKRGARWQLVKTKQGTFTVRGSLSRFDAFMQILRNLQVESHR